MALFFLSFFSNFVNQVLNLKKEIMEVSQTHILFKTVQSSRAVIIDNPFVVIERYTTGQNKGKIKRRRPAQYCKDLESIFIDEQKKIDENPVMTPLLIQRGAIKVDMENLTLLEAFRKHPQNQANGGNLFKEVDLTKEEEEALRQAELLHDVERFIIKADDNIARTMGMFYLGTKALRYSPSKIKLTLKDMVQTNAFLREELMKFSQDKNVTAKTMAALSLTTGVLTLEGKKFLWSGTNEIVYVASNQSDAIQELAKWFTADENGRQTYDAVVSKIDAETE